MRRCDGCFGGGRCRWFAVVGGGWVISFDFFGGGSSAWESRGRFLVYVFVYSSPEKLELFSWSVGMAPPWSMRRSCVWSRQISIWSLFWFTQRPCMVGELIACIFGDRLDELLQMENGRCWDASKSFLNFFDRQRTRNIFQLGVFAAHLSGRDRWLIALNTLNCSSPWMGSGGWAKVGMLKVP